MLLAIIAVTERQRLIENTPVQLLLIEQASRITIDLYGGEKNSVMELQKQADGWRLISPVEASVNQNRIVPLLSLLTLPDSTAYPVADIDLDELGFTKPSASVQINDHTFVFGGPGPGEQQRYLMINEHIYLTRDILLPLVSGGADSLITTTAE